MSNMHEEKNAMKLLNVGERGHKIAAQPATAPHPCFIISRFFGVSRVK